MNFVLPLSHAMEAKDIFKLASSSVVLIESYSEQGKQTGIGTGFVAGNGDKIVTNAHVVANSKYVKCKISSEEIITITKLTYINFDHDIAILKCSRSLEPLRITDSSVEVGENVFVIGNPLGLEKTLTTGIVSGKRLYKGYDFLQISAPISPGNSGGPVLDSNGKVIGISTFMLTEGQNLNFAIDAKAITKLIDIDTTMELAGISKTPQQASKQTLPQFKIPVAMDLVFGNFNLAYNASLWKKTDIWYNDSWVQMGKHNGYSVVYPVKSEKITEDGLEKIILFLKIAPYIDFDSGRGSQPYLGYIVFSCSDNKWLVDHYKFAIEKFGRYGSIPDPHAVKLGPNKTGFYLEEESGGQGQDAATAFLYALNAGSPTCVFKVNTKDGYEGIGGLINYNNETTWRFLDNTNEGYYNIETITRGTSLDKSKSKAVICNSKIMYTFNKDRYFRVMPDGNTIGNVQRLVESLLAVKDVNGVDAISSYYSDMVSFYGKQLGRDEILKQKKDYIKRWSQLNYKLLDLDVQQTNEADVKRVIGTVEFFAKNSMKEASGVTESIWTVRISGDSLVILSESSKVLQRY